MNSPNQNNLSPRSNYDESFELDSDGSWETTSSNSKEESEDLNEDLEDSDDLDDEESYLEPDDETEDEESVGEDSQNDGESDNESEESDDAYGYGDYDPTKPIIVNYSLGLSKETDKNEEDCGICLDDTKPLIETSCGHIFHTACLNQWFGHSKNCPTCRKDFNYRKEFNDEMFFEFLKNDENKMIETISISVNKIFYNCDMCDKQIEEPEIRYHKNGLNYDLCDECYQSNSENLNSEEYTKLLSNHLVLDGDNSFPSNLKTIKIDGELELKNINLKSLQSLQGQSIKLSSMDIETDNVEMFESEIFNSNFKNCKNILINNSNMDSKSLVSIMENISQDITDIEIGAYVKKYENNKNIVIKKNIFEPIYNNLTKLIINLDILLFTNSDFDFSNYKLKEIIFLGVVFNDIKGFPDSIEKITFNRLSLKSNKFDFSNCSNLLDIVLTNTPISEIKFSTNYEKQEVTFENQLILENCELESIDYIPDVFNLVNLSRNKLKCGTFKLNMERTYSCIDLSFNQIKSLEFIPKKVTNLKLSNNLLENVDLSSFEFVTDINFVANKIKNFIGNKSLNTVFLNKNYLTEFKVLKNMWFVDISSNKLKKLLIDENLKTLRDLNCSNNKLEYIDLKNLELTSFNCRKNKINKIMGYKNVRSEIDISNNPIDEYELNSEHYHVLNINKTNITKLSINGKLKGDITIGKFKFNHKLIKNKILVFKHKKNSDNFKKNYIIINEPKTNFKFINNE
jgi:hypothetical protein